MKRLIVTMIMFFTMLFALSATATCMEPVPNCTIGNNNNPATSYIVYVHPDSVQTRWIIGSHDIANNTNNFYVLDFGATSPLRFSGPGWTSDGSHVITSFSFGSHLDSSGNTIMSMNINGVLAMNSTGGGFFTGQNAFSGGLTGIYGGGINQDSGHAYVDLIGISNGVPAQKRKVLTYDCRGMSNDLNVFGMYLMPTVKNNNTLWWNK